MGLQEQGRQHVTGSWVKIVVWAVEVGRHGGDEVAAILTTIRLAQLDPCDLRNRIPLVRRLQRTRQQCRLWDRLWREARIDARRSQQQQFFDTCPPRAMDHIGFDNNIVETNVIHSAWRTGVEKLLLLGSSCIYPRLAPQPIPETALLTGALEPTNEWYAIAKIAGIKLCQAYRRQYGCDFISTMPPNLYGPNDNFDPASSHVLPALLLKAHRAKIGVAQAMEIWGSGSPRREFLYVDDLADALVHVMKTYSEEETLNVGAGYDITIAELAQTIMRVVDLKARLQFDRSKPDGTPRKLMDSGRLLAMGWKPTTSLEEGLRKLYAWFLETAAAVP